MKTIKTIIILAAALCFVTATGWAATVNTTDLPTVTSITPATDTVIVNASGATSQITGANLGVGSIKYGTLTNGKVCTYASAGTLLSCNTDPFQVNLGLVAGTLTNTYLCTYTAAGTLLDCNTNPASFQPADADLTTYAGITPSANIQTFLGSADYATARTNLGTWGVSGSITDEQVVCGETTGGTNLLKSCGVKVANNASTSGGPRLVALDNANPATIQNLAVDPHILLTGTTNDLNMAIRVHEFDGSAHVHLTAAQMTGPGAYVYNTGMADGADVLIEFPVAAAGLSALFDVGTARAYHWGVCGEHAAGNKITLIAAAGTVAEGSADDCVVMAAAQVGQSFGCWSWKTATGYDWKCKAIAIGTSTFDAHAH